MTDNRDDDRRPPAAAPMNNRKWLPWVIGAAALLIVLLLLSRCGGDRTADTVAPTPDATVEAPAATTPAVAVAAPTGVSGLDAYLAGTEAAPRTFIFERVHFDSGKSDIRAEDRPEIQAIAATLNKYPNARVRLLGYADAAGAAPANVTLAQARANVVRSALAAAGVDARRVEALSGGESNPVAANATAAGMAENRRTELVVVQR